MKELLVAWFASSDPLRLRVHLTNIAFGTSILYSSLFGLFQMLLGTSARGLTGEPVAPTNFKGVQKKVKR